MKKGTPLIIGVLVVIVVALIMGFVVAKMLTSGKLPQTVVEEQSQEVLPPVDASIMVDVTKSRTQSNAVLLSVKGMGGKMKTVAYELTYDSQGITQGVSAKPVEVEGKDVFERDIYLGTCSRNVCRPHPGVTKVSVTLLFIDMNGNKSQFAKDFTL